MMALILILVCSALVFFSVVSVWWVSRRQKHLSIGQEALPALTVLKPLCGVDDSLARNLESFFVQDYPDYELLFGVEGEQDLAAQVVRALKRRYPHVSCRLVLHNGGRALNPKVSNLRAMLESGSHDLVVISDSNVEVRPDYLTGLARAMSEEGVGLVTSPIIGVAEQSLGATLENLQLNGTIAGSVAASAVLDKTLVVGKSMMFRRSTFSRLGGFATVANLLAEDYVIGRMYRQAGLKVRLSAQPVLNVVQRGTVATFLKRHLRWAMLRTRLKPVIYPFEVLANPMCLAAAAPFLGLGLWPMALGAALSMTRDGLCWLRLRGPRGLWAALPLSPIKDALLLLIWLWAPLRRHVAWRGKTLRLSSGTWLYAHDPMQSPRPIIRE